MTTLNNFIIFSDFCSKLQVFFCLNCQIPGKVATLVTSSLHCAREILTKILY